MFRNQEQWIVECKQRGALWIHDGNPKRPHVILTTGEMHSTGFFNAAVVCEDVQLASEAASDLLTLLYDAGLKADEIDRVVGPTMGAVDISIHLALEVARRRHRTCFRGFAEKIGEGDSKRFQIGHTSMHAGERVLPAEDTMTTSASVAASIAASEAEGAVILPFVAMLLNRSGRAMVNGRKVVALIDYTMPRWTAADCEMCKEGSEPLRAKGNWAALNAQY